MLTTVLTVLILVAVIAGGLALWRDRKSQEARARRTREADSAYSVAPEIGMIEFERRVSETDDLVVVMFFASWCPSCGRQLPHFLEVAREMGAEATFVRMDTDKCKSLTRRLGLKKIPTIMIFKGSNAPLAINQGVLPPGRLKAFVEEAA